MMTISTKSNGRRTTKTGCKTCKIRRVKCDENRPVCSRCTSSGRTCDGYGIWGGGEHRLAHVERSTAAFSSKRSRTLPLDSPAMISLLANCTPSEKRCFEWFTGRTIRKVPGPFALKFWDRLVVQACLTEPAVMHAVLAMGFVHHGGIECESGRDSSAQQRMALQNYSKAIAKLQPHFNSKDRTCLRITLITCIVFISLEFLRGRFQTAEVHLANGLRVLHVLDSLRSHEPADDWISQAFARLCLQRELLKASYHTTLLDIPESGLPEVKKSFTTVEEAWLQLEDALNTIFNITAVTRAEILKLEPDKDILRNLLDRQRTVKEILGSWLQTFDTSTCEFGVPEQLPMVVRLLRSYHAMATIMASTCLESSESQYINHASDFQVLIHHSTEMWQYRDSNPMTRVVQRRGLSMAHSMVDIGWLPPLFYAATKCRIKSVRWQAIRLMEYAMHREGMWDSQITAAVAKTVVEAEESSGQLISEIDVRLADDEGKAVTVRYEFEGYQGPPEVVTVHV